MKKIFLIVLYIITSSVYAQDSTNIIQAENFTNQKIDLLKKIELNSILACAPLVDNNKLFIIEKLGTISCYDTSGRLTWKNDLRVEITTRPVIVDGFFVVGDSNGDVFLLESKTGNQVQSIGIDKKISSDIISFPYNGDIELAIPKMSASKDAIIFATEDGKMHCYDLETLQEYWTNNDAKDTVKGTPLYIDNKIFFNSADGYLYCINAKNGLLIWRWKETAESSFYNSNIVSDGKTIFVVSDGGDIIGIDLLLGKLSWKSNNIKIFPALELSRDKKTLLAQSIDDRIILFSTNQGKIVRTIKLEETLDDTPLPIIERENKLLFTRGNKLYSIGIKYSEELLLALGNSKINFITQLDEDRFFISYINGTLLIFRMR